MRNIRKRKEKAVRDPDQRQCNSDQVTKKGSALVAQGGAKGLYKHIGIRICCTVLV